jgi:hypothetical protein
MEQVVIYPSDFVIGGEPKDEMFLKLPLVDGIIDICSPLIGYNGQSQPEANEYIP